MKLRSEILNGECREVLATLPEQSVQCVVTSPPYWLLRDYGVDGQLGSEVTFATYIAAQVEVFRAVRRVLRDDGTLWLNMGDGYATSSASGTQGQSGERADRTFTSERMPARTPVPAKNLIGQPWRLAFALQADGWYLRSDIIWAKPNHMPESVTDRPTKSHEYVFLLTKRPRYFYDADAVREAADPQYASRYRYGFNEGPKEAGGQGRPDGASNTPGCKPYSGGRNLRTVWQIATQPYAKAHFATFPEKLVVPCIKAGTSEKGCCPECGAPWGRVVEKDLSCCDTVLSEVREVSDPGAIAEYLTHSRKSAGLTCKQVDDKLGTETLYSWYEGRPAGIQTPTVDRWRQLKVILKLDDRFDEAVAATKAVEVTVQPDARAARVCPSRGRRLPKAHTIGWQPGCECSVRDGEPEDQEDIDYHQPIPCTVLDCYAGSGTTGVVAKQLGRSFIGIELNPEYCEMARQRIANPYPQPEVEDVPGQETLFEVTP